MYAAEELYPFDGEQYVEVVTGADLIVGIAREIIAERIAGATQHFQSTLRQRTGTNSTRHGNLQSGIRNQESGAGVHTRYAVLGTQYGVLGSRYSKLGSLIPDAHVI